MNPSEFESDFDVEEVHPPPAPKQAKKLKGEEIKRRSTKACDGCRKSKCKCIRDALDAPCTNCIALSLTCSNVGISRKRGPLKGYIEVVENKLRRMEELLGGLLASDDPRAELLAELIGQEQVHELRTMQVLKPQVVPQTKKVKNGSGSNINGADGSISKATLYPLASPACYTAPPDVDDISSPRQRRKLELPGGNEDASAADAPKSMAYSFGARSTSLDRSSIGHTGFGRSAEEEKVTELEDVLGQLSLNENSEVRYHGRSSGLYLISQSNKFRDFFWKMPSPWPSTNGGTSSSAAVVRTEEETLKLIGVRPNPLPPHQKQQELLDLYFTYVHPHFPIMVRSSFERQYRFTLAHPDSTEPSTSGGRGPVPTVLLLAMFALSSRYSETDREAGDSYFLDACKIVNFDLYPSKLVIVQSLLLLAYREIGTGGMSSSWMYTGMAIRLAQDLGLFRDVDKWALPVDRFDFEERQARKRVWWGSILLDRYVSTFIGRPGMINERDYDVAFISENEPEEHEQWRPISGDDATGARYASMKSHTLSCFNAGSALSVIINRIIAGVYAIRVRVVGQSSEKLLSLLDQSLASWFLALPPHLAFNISSKRSVPPPHVLCLHLQFYSALILLHRPFIPGSSARSDEACFPSHAICTTAANAIAHIVAVFSQTFSLRQCPPFLTYPLFSAGIICVFNIGFDESLAGPAKSNLRVLMNALRDLAFAWPGASRQYELLDGLVDLRLGPLEGVGAADSDSRGTKRQSADVDDPMLSFVIDPDLDTLPRQQPSQQDRHRPLSRNRRASSTSRSAQYASQSPSSYQPSLPLIIDPIMEPPIYPSSFNRPDQLGSDFITPSLSPQINVDPFATYIPQSSEGSIHNSYDILTYADPSQLSFAFRERSGTSTPTGTNYNELLNMTRSPMRSSMSEHPMGIHSLGSAALSEGEFDMQNSAFFGSHIGADDWSQFLPSTFFSNVPSSQ